MNAATIDEVLLHLRTVIDDACKHKDRAGYFAALYYKMTLAIKSGMEQGVFDDAARMERLDVAFANRYLDAYSAYRNGLPLTASWQTAFTATRMDTPVVLQHLLLGINAHINLDLGIAAAVISTKDTIAELQADFLKVNETIGSLFAEVQDSLSQIAFPMYFVKNINPDSMHAVLDFSIGKARDLAWSNALLLTEAGVAALPAVISQTDAIVARVAQGILAPGKWMGFLLRCIRWCEHGDVADNIAFIDVKA